MDLDGFGQLHQHIDDLDGFPVRFDEDMDLLDFDTAFQTPVPGSFQDFANWLADNSGTVASTRNPESAGPNTTCQLQNNISNQPTNNQQLLGGMKYEDTWAPVSESQQQINLQLDATTQQQQAVAAAGSQNALDVMRQNSVHSSAQGKVYSQGSPGVAGAVLHRAPTAQDSFRSQPSCSGPGAGLPDASLLLQQQQQPGDLLAMWDSAQQQAQQAQQQQEAQQQQQQQHQAAAASAALSAAASKAQQLLMSCSSGFQAPAASMPPATAGCAFTPQHSTAGLASYAPSLALPGFGGMAPQPGMLMASPHGAVLQPTLLIGGAGGSAHQAAAAAAMAAAQNPFAAASLAGGLNPGMGLGINLGLGAQQGYGQQGLALHASALHSLVGHGVLKQTALDRQQKARKRNTVQSLEAELTEKLGQLQLLTAENEMLKLRAGVLEATVQNREDQMRVVWEHGPPTFPIDCPSGDCGGANGAAGGAQGEDGGQAGAAAEQQQQQQQKQGLGFNTAVGSSGQLAGMWDEPAATAAAAGAGAGGPQMPHTPSARAEPVASPVGTARTASNCSNLSGTAAAVPSSPSSSSNCGGSGGTDSTFDAHTALLPLPQQKDSLQSIKRMTDVDVIRHWKNFLQEVTSALVQLQREESAAAANAPPAAAAAGSGGSKAQQQQQQAHEASSPASAGAAAAAAAAVVSPAEQRVRDLVDKYCYLVRISQTLNPSAYCRLFGRHLDTGEAVPYNDNHWRNVVAVLGLSKDQVTHILACAELYFSSRAKLQAEQRALQAQLKAAELSPLDLLGGEPDNPLRPWLEQLGSNLKREHNLRIMLNSYVWGRIFTHVQKAKAAVYSHPLYVDIHALVCVMCEDALAAAGAPRSNSSNSAAQQQQQQQAQQHLQQQQQFAAAYAACQQQQQQHMAGYAQFMNGQIQHTFG